MFNWIIKKTRIGFDEDKEPEERFYSFNDAMKWMIAKAAEYTNAEWMYNVGSEGLTVRVGTGRHVQFYRLRQV